MKTFCSWTLVFLITLSFAACSGTPENSTSDEVITPDETINLWNGENFSDWEFFLDDSTTSPTEIWSAENGVIACTGEVNGYMRTSRQYANYRLHVEWRWPEEAGNSGVFLHMQEPDQIWPETVECQLQSGNAGDLIAFPDVDFDERTDKSSIRVQKREERSENPVGEWNTYSIECDGSSIRVEVNGVLQNVATNTTISQGYICLQSEGAPVEFRNVYLEPLN